MASVVSSAPTLSKQDIAELRSAIRTKAFFTPEIGAFHMVVPNVNGKKRIGILGQYSGLSGKVKSNCDITPAAGTSAISEKEWDPAYISDRFEQCFEDLMGTCVQWMLKNGKMKEDISNTEFSLWLETEVLNIVIHESWFRQAWFGNTALNGTTYDGIGATELPYFNSIDGLFKQIFALNGGASWVSNLNSKNTQTTTAAQAFTSTDVTNQVVTNTFRDLYYAADKRIRQVAKNDLVWLCTQSVSDQFEKERLAVASIDTPYRRAEEGFGPMTAMGIDVVPVHFWDRTIETYFEVTSGGNTNLFKPHRMILTTRTNLMIGTESANDLQTFDVDYDKYNKKWYCDYGFMLDALVGADELVAAAY
jgi:hypothetical protein